MNLPTMTINDIRRHDPCYDPARYLPEDWTGTALDILRDERIPPRDRIWVVTRPGRIDDTTLRLWAVWCARQALALVADPDPRSVAACDVAERFALGAATDDELAAARAAAWDAAYAAWAAWDAYAAWDATWAAAWDAYAAAYAATRTAARTAAWAATRTAARTATRTAAWGAQVAHLIEMLAESGG